jgi:hypothetical protein
VKILRQFHPLQGRDLEVMGGLRRGGIQLLLIALPDGSRTLVPERWTNWKLNETDCALASGDEGRERCIAPLADLLPPANDRGRSPRPRIDIAARASHRRGGQSCN